MNLTLEILNATNSMANNPISCIGGCGSGLGFFVVAGIIGGLLILLIMSIPILKLLLLKLKEAWG
jgi:hypothetical protein